MWAVRAAARIRSEQVCRVIDMVVHRHALKDRLGRLIDYLAPRKDKAKKAA